MIPQQFSGLLHGASPVFENREDPFTGGGESGSKTAGPRTGASAVEVKGGLEAAVTGAAMQSCPLDPKPRVVYKTILHTSINQQETGGGACGRGAGPLPCGRIRPPGDLKLARSLSKSDSDLLVSPPSEEDGLGSRSESISNCSGGKKRLEKSPSFASEWDEVRTPVPVAWSVLVGLPKMLHDYTAGVLISALMSVPVIGALSAL